MLVLPRLLRLLPFAKDERGVPMSFMCSSMTESVSLITGDSMPIAVDIGGFMDGAAELRRVAGAMGDIMGCCEAVALDGRGVMAEVEECLCCAGDMGPLLR